jgi:hypothetical protein
MSKESLGAGSDRHPDGMAWTALQLGFSKVPLWWPGGLRCATATEAASGVRWRAATPPPARNLLRRRKAEVGEQWPAPPVRGLGSLIYTRVANSGGNFAGSTKGAAVVAAGAANVGPLEKNAA